jgi:6-phosphofructokinase 1
MGYHTVDLLAQGIGNRVVVMKENHVVDYDIFEALKMEKKFDRTLYDINNTISI